MKAIVITRPGGSEVLEIREVPTPEPRGDQVRVRVRACGLNRADLMQCRGNYPAPPGSPADIPGLEFAGEVDALGPDVTGPLKVGDRVFGIVGGGGQAEYVVTHERMAVPIPANLDFDAAAAVPEVFVTAHDALETQAGVRPGERVLVHAVGSGVGSAAVQLAHAMGCTVFGTSRTASKLARGRRARARRRHREHPRGLRGRRPPADRRGGRRCDHRPARRRRAGGQPRGLGDERPARAGRAARRRDRDARAGPPDAEAADGRRHHAPRPAAGGEDRRDPAVRRPGRPLARARAGSSGRRPGLPLRATSAPPRTGSNPTSASARSSCASDRPSVLSWPSWISSTRSSGVMNRRSCVTTTSVVWRWLWSRRRIR